MWYLILGAVIALWVGWDAYNRQNNVVGWTLGAFLLGVFVVPFYLAKRHLKKGEVREGGTAWNVLRYFALIWTIYLATAGIVAVSAASETATTATSAAGETGAAIGTALGMGVIGAIWFFPMVGALVLGFFLKKNSIVEEGPTGPLATEAEAG